MPETVRVAAVQMSADVADVDANLRQCEELADRAGAAGACWIVLPEFFDTGMAYDSRLHGLASPADGEPARLLARLAERHGAYVGGSFICAGGDGARRNAFMLFAPDGTPAGRHDKDLPTMWENCYYERGSDDGVVALSDGLDVGMAMCWELIRSGTARRLRERVDLIVGGSCWWSVPGWPPRSVTARMETANTINATRAAARMARMTGAPVVHAAHCGPIECRLPLTPCRYRGRTEGGAAIFDAEGDELAFRGADEGPGVVVADLPIGRRAAPDPVPDDYWLTRRGPIPAMAWWYQGVHGRAEYARTRARA